jgi:glyoxylate/hydroxypyruvate reductase A
MTILVAADFDADEWSAWRPALEAALPGERFVRESGDAPPESIDVAFVANPAAGALRGLPGLRLIQSLWAGVDRLLTDASVPADVPLARLVDPAMNERMAEIALWAVLGLHRNGFAYALQQRDARWRPLPLARADEVSVAVLGLGQMGRTVAARLACNGYRVFGWSARSTRIDGVEVDSGDVALVEVLARAGIVVNLLPLTPATRGLFNAATFARMAGGASLVNLARGAHVVDADLLAALDSGRLAHAVLDVFQTEPLPPSHPFWSHPRISVLPHVAAPTDPRSAAPIVARNVRALRAGEALANLVDRTRGY